MINKQKWLTPYALACGYIETVHSKRYSLELSNNMGDGYDVRAYDSKEHKRLCWESFYTLTEARKYFSRICKQLNVKRRLPKK
jgi:hypothetical protein